jgi:hypothetical protein
MNSDGDTFLARIQGRVVPCKDVYDAIAINKADGLLDDGQPSTGSELQRLAEILRRYHCDEEAEKLGHRACRVRAMEYLSHSVSYEPPSQIV